MKALQSIGSIYLGWKYNQKKDQAFVNKKSRSDFIISIVIAFLIIFVITQLLSYLDKTLKSGAQANNFSLINPLEVNIANALSETKNEAIKMIQSSKLIIVSPNQLITEEIGFKNLTDWTWQQLGDNQVELVVNPGIEQIEPGYMISQENQPGHIAYFNLKINAPEAPGTYEAEISLIKNEQEVLLGSQMVLIIRVKDDGQGSVHSSSMNNGNGNISGEESNETQLPDNLQNQTEQLSSNIGGSQSQDDYSILQDDDYLIRRRRLNNPVLNSQPLVSSVYLSDLNITAEDIGSQLIVEVTYNKVMDQSIKPAVKGIFNNLTDSNDLLYLLECPNQDIVWVNATTIRGVCTILDNKNVILNSEQIVSIFYGARDTAGNSQVPYTFIGSEHSFAINTFESKNPYIQEIILSKTKISAEDIGTGFIVRLKYNKKMNTSIWPSCYGVACDLLDPNSENYLLEVVWAKTGWLDNERTFKVKFKIVNNPNVVLSPEEISTVIFGAKDNKGREQLPYYYSGTQDGFYIDTTK